jgi:hypothetical protein
VKLNYLVIGNWCLVIKYRRLACKSSGSKMLSGILAHPASSLLQGPVELNSAGDRTLGDTGTAVPALIGMQNNRAFAFFRIGDIYIYGADFNTAVTTLADSRIENYRPAGSDDVRDSI